MNIPNMIDSNYVHTNGFLFEVSDRTKSFVAPNGNDLNIPSGVYTKNEDDVSYFSMENYEDVGISLVDDLVESRRTECNYVPDWIETFRRNHGR